MPLVKKNKAFLYSSVPLLLLLHTYVNPNFSDLEYYGYAYNTLFKYDLKYLLSHNQDFLKAEVGYRILSKLFSLINNSFVFWLFVTSFITLYGYYYCTKKYSNYAWLSVIIVMLGIFLQSTFVLRQHMAMGIVLLSYPFVLKKKIIPYLLTILLAISIHQTAAIFLPVYFLYHIKGKYKIMLLLVLVAIYLYFSMGYLLRIASSLASDSTQYGEYYFEKTEEGTNWKIAGLLIFILLVRFIIMGKKSFSVGINKLLTIVLILGAIIALAGIGYLGTARMYMYYSNCTFLVIPNIILYISKKKLRTIFVFAYLAFLFYFHISSIFDPFWNEIYFFYP